MKHTPKPTLEELLAEAYEIADGKTIKIGTTAHVRALVVKLRAIVEAAEKLKDLLPLITIPTDAHKAYEIGIIVGNFLKLLNKPSKG